jgi:hypothetical protein
MLNTGVPYLLDAQLPPLRNQVTVCCERIGPPEPPPIDDLSMAKLVCLAGSS